MKNVRQFAGGRLVAGGPPTRCRRDRDDPSIAGLGTALRRALPLLMALAVVSAAAAESRQESRTILFLGDSLTAGYGLSPEEAFPSLIADRLRDRDLPFEVVNAGVPGDTSAGGLRRIDWLLRRQIDILVLELGANDMLRGLPLDMTKANLQAIIDKARAANPRVEIVVAGMLAPPNLGPEYTTEFREIFPALAEANDAALIPFLLQDVAARPELNLPDGIHPNAAGQQIVANGVWAALEPLLDLGGAAVR
jgi:acyl-CoA thioesterase-1